MNKDQLREAVLGTAAWQQAGLLTEASAPTQSQETEDVAEGHTCPLCESDLGEEDLSDEELLEHAEQMLGMFEEAGQIISEQAANEAEGDEEDLLEGLDEEDIQHLVNLSREMKSEYERTDETGSRGRRVKRFEKMNGRGSWEAMGGTPKGSEPDTVRGWRDPFQEPDERAGTDTMKPKPKHDPRGQRRRQKRQK